MSAAEIVYDWRGEFSNAELNILHAEGFSHRVMEVDFRGLAERHSLGWVCARREGSLAGWVNVAWDGDVHAFILDTVVSGSAQRLGIGTSLVEVAVREARAAGCEWLHVDFEPHLREFYFDACGFKPADAGLIALRE